MDPREFHILASKLVQDSSPAHLRTAISRAYYATFNVSVEILKSMGIIISTGPAAHGQVQRFLNNCGNSEVTKVGSQIIDLHSKRIEADYRLHKQSAENQKTAQAVVKQAFNMISALDSHCSGSERSNIVSTIKEYQSTTRQ